MVSRRRRRLSQRHAEQILCISVLLCATFLTGGDIFFSRKGAKFHKVCVVLRSLRGMVSHGNHGRHRIPAERYGLTQTAQTFAEACGANSVYSVYSVCNDLDMLSV